MSLHLVYTDESGAAAFIWRQGETAPASATGTAAPRSRWLLYAPASAACIVFGTPRGATSGATHTATGALTAQAATLAGTAVSTKTGTGALAAQAAAVAGAAAHVTLHAADGALAAQAASLAGTARRRVWRIATGGLVAGYARISGSDVAVPVAATARTYTPPGELRVHTAPAEIRTHSPAAQTRIWRATA